MSLGFLFLALSGLDTSCTTIIYSGDMNIRLIIWNPIRYLASAFFAILLATGLVLVEMPLSDPGVFSDQTQPNDIFETLAFGAGMIVLGLVGTIGFRNVYRQHRTYRKILSGILGFVLLVMGIAGMQITAHSSTMPYLIFGIIWEFIDFAIGGYLLGQIWNG